MSLVSVVIPTYNRANELRSAIRSVFAQDWTDIELLVVDDGSTDATAATVEEFPLARLIQLPRTAQLGAVRNAGIQAARGDFVAFLDSDDTWLPTKISEQMRSFSREPDCIISATNAFVTTELQGDTAVVYFRHSEDKLLGVRDLVVDNPVIVSTVVARTKYLRKVGGFMTLPILHGIEDYDLWLRLSLLGDITYIHKPLAHYKDNPATSMRGQRSRAQEVLGILVILGRFSRNLRHADEDVAALVRARIDALMSELTWSVESRWSRRFRKASRRGGEGLRLWFGPTKSRAALTVARRKECSAKNYGGASEADAFAEVAELWFPESSIDLIGITLDPCRCNIVDDIAAAARRWLRTSGRLIIDGSADPDCRLPLAMLEESGFELTSRESADHVLELKRCL
jgi:teichuronic acid biosynthesis glycosyltransferase TuaG